MGNNMDGGLPSERNLDTWLTEVGVWGRELAGQWGERPPSSVGWPGRSGFGGAILSTAVDGT